ncbi:MAG: hypothetical protein LKJ22_00860 [Liquorilactobacillus nagelii]|jgi:hypothetical protein|uniref:hypothetical protein n=1 Tax=Liquorilactobacillus nagelii TaxID=82688 RepID=UPI00242A76FF|nr:hypothetical protein [Liquorilactobacillus nagelii]MCI1920453.1 hypothetical protein [Liquorilactobacillus nagelii]MCI1976097.1 hypothetical protein [Liquorilactobacillus nagelii]
MELINNKKDLMTSLEEQEISLKDTLKAMEQLTIYANKLQTDIDRSSKLAYVLGVCRGIRTSL